MSRARISQTGGLPSCNGNQAAVLQYPRLLCSVTESAWRGSLRAIRATVSATDAASFFIAVFLVAGVKQFTTESS